MISNLNGSGSVRVHGKKAVFTSSRFRFGFGSTWLAIAHQVGMTSPDLFQTQCTQNIIGSGSVRVQLHKI